MATFTPPFVDGNLMHFPNKPGPASRLYRFYGSWATGVTVWRDSSGVWHEALIPYLAGATHTVHDWNMSTISEPDEGLATAEVVYLGGHVYEITAEEEAALIAAGYEDGITP